MSSTAPPAAPAQMPPRERLLSGAELLLGAALVLGHNVWRLLPNEVPLLLVLGLLSLRLRDGGWTAIGLRRPAWPWRRVLLVALGAAVLRILLGDLVVEPLTSQFWPAPKAPAGAEQIAGNLGKAALGLLIVWSFAAFGEELGYRGWLLRRALDVAGGSRAGQALALLLAALLFGAGHWYKGPAGVLDSAVAGLILGGVYLWSGRNLWPCILAHGFIDTTAVLFVFFGWNS